VNEQGRCGPTPRPVTLAELRAMGELPLDEKVRLGDVTIGRPTNSTHPDVSGKYYAWRGGLYLWRDGQWREGAAKSVHDRELPGYFDDLETLLDHLFVALHRPTAPETPDPPASE
jgi:hypothetical protein